MGKKLFFSKWFYIPTILFFFYKTVFNPFTGQFLLDKASSLSQGKISGNVKQFSLFFGIEIQDIEILASPTFENKPILTSKRLAVLYNLPAVLLLWGKINEITLEKTKVSLYKSQSKGWNFASLFPQESQEKEEEIPETTPPTEEISLYLPLKASLAVSILDLDLEYTQEDKDGKFSSIQYEDLDFQTNLETNRFRSIPLSPKVLDILKEWDIAWNLERVGQLSFQLPDLEGKIPVQTKLFLHQKRDSSHWELDSYLNLGIPSSQVTFKQKKIQIPSIRMGYQLQFFPGQEELKLQELSIHWADSVWLLVKGNLTQVFGDSPQMNLAVEKSNVRLSSLRDLMKQFPGLFPNLNLGGSLSLENTFARGSLNHLNANLQLVGNDLQATAGGKVHKIPQLEFQLKALLNLKDPPDSTASRPIAILKEMETILFQAVYNDISVSLTGAILKDNLNLSLLAKGISLAQFSSEAKGRLNVNLQLTGKDFSLLNLELKAHLEALRYQIGRSLSGQSRIHLDSQIQITAKEPFGYTAFEIPILDIKLWNIKNKLGLGVWGNLSAGLNPYTKLSLNSLKVSPYIEELSPTLPLSLRETILPLKDSLGNDPKLNLSGTVELPAKETLADLKLQADIPGLELKDLVATAKIKMLQKPKEEKKILIDSLRLTGFGEVLSVQLKGILEEDSTKENPSFGNFFADLDLTLGLKSEVVKYLLKGIDWKGDLGLNVKIKNSLIQGELFSNNSSLWYSNQKCPGTQCRLYIVDQWNAKIPISHDLRYKNKQSLVEGNKTKFMKNMVRIAPHNFTIEKVMGSHPTIEGSPFAFLQREGNFPGLSLRIDYVENFLSIDDFRLFTLNGVVYGKDILVAVGEGDVSKMDYTGVLQIKDIDLKQLLPPKSQGKIDDGKIKADLNFSGTNLSDPVPNLKLFFSIFQIGNDFGKSVMNVISPSGLLMDTITNSFAVDKVEVELSKGLVYADVFLKPSLRALLFTLEGNKISQTRMPLANFLNRAQSEIEAYE